VLPLRTDEKQHHLLPRLATSLDAGCVSVRRQWDVLLLIGIAPDRFQPQQNAALPHRGLAYGCHFTDGLPYGDVFSLCDGLLAHVVAVNGLRLGDGIQ